MSEFNWQRVNDEFRYGTWPQVHNAMWELCDVAMKRRNGLATESDLQKLTDALIDARLAADRDREPLQRFRELFEAGLMLFGVNATAVDIRKFVLAEDASLERFFQDELSKNEETDE